MTPEERKDLAKDFHEIARATVSQSKRPWWLSWGIPLLALGLLGWFTNEMYQNLKDGQNATMQSQKEASQTNAAQNESLAVTARVLQGLQKDITETRAYTKEESLALRQEIQAARADPWTATDDAQTRREMYDLVERGNSVLQTQIGRHSDILDKHAVRLDRLDNFNTSTRINTERINGKLNTLLENIKN